MLSLQGGREFLLAAGVQATVELARERDLEPAADVGALGNAGSDEVVTVDLESHVSQLLEPEPRRHRRTEGPRERDRLQGPRAQLRPQSRRRLWRRDRPRD